MKGVFPVSWGRTTSPMRGDNLSWLNPPSDDEEEEGNDKKRKRDVIEEEDKINEEPPKKTLLPPYESLVSCNPGKRKSRTENYRFPTQESGVYEEEVTVSSSSVLDSSHNHYTLDWTFGMPRAPRIGSIKRKYHTKKVSPTEESHCVTQRNGKRETPSLTRSYSSGSGVHRGKFISEGQARMELATLRKYTQIECHEGKWKFTSMQKLLKEVMRLSKTLPKFEFTEQTYGSPKWRNRDVAVESVHFIPEEVKNMDIKVHPIIIRGDGNCGPRSLSRVIWGTDEHHVAIRLWLGVEMLRHSNYYNEREKQFEWGFPKVVKEGLYVGGDIKRNHITQTKTPFSWERPRFVGSNLSSSKVKREHLRNEFRSRLMKKRESMVINEDVQIKTEGYIDLLHLQAAANIFNRVIILYASESMGRYCQYYRYSFLPDRVPDNIVPKHPIALMWANNAMNHFVPIVPVINRSTISPVPSHSMPLWPIPKPYGFVKTSDGKFKQSGEMTEEEISEIVNKYTILTHPIMNDPR